LSEVSAIRNDVGLSDDAHIAFVRVRGEDARAFLDDSVPLELYLTDAQIRPTLLLDDDGRILGDLLVARDDDEWLLSCEGVEENTLLELLLRRAGDRAVTIEPLSLEHRAFSLHGPWAWELLGDVLGPDVIGMPYLTLLRGEAIVLRTGKTGEFGYHVIAKHGAHDALLARVREAGRAFGLTDVSLATLDLCALENGFFSIRSRGARGGDPLEWQLQWRLSRTKQHRAADALRGRVGNVARRVTTFVADAPVEVGAMVTVDGATIGEVVAAAESPLLGRTMGAAMLARECAHAGIDRFRVGEAAIRTVSPPVLDNRSLFVRAQRHSYRTRNEHAFPPVVP